MFNSISNFFRKYRGGKGEKEDNGLSVLNTDSYDIRRFNELFNMSNKLKKLSENESPPLFKELLGDIWASFYKLNPKLADKNELDTSLHANHNFMNRIMHEEFYKKYKKNTELDDMLSVLGAMEMGEKTIHWFEQQLERNEQMKQQLEKMQQMANDMRKNKENEQDNQKDSSNSSNGDLTEQLDQVLGQFADSLQDSLNSQGGELIQSLEKAVEEAEETNDNLETMFGGSGQGSGESDLQKIPLREKIRLAEIIRNDRKIKNIADWAGRFKKIARSKHKTLFKEGVGRGGVTMGNDLMNTLPSEIFLYFDQRTKKDFVKRFEQKKLLQYETSGKDNLGKGSIVFIIDQSDSMEDLDEQSKAFGLALMSIARRQKRNFVYIPFSSHVGRVRYFKDGKIKPNVMIELATNFMSGGTDFQEPLEEAINVLRKDKYKDADIVFVTDGEDRVSDSFLEKFKKEKDSRNFSVLSLVIGNKNTNTVKKFSDKVVAVNSFDEEGAFEAFEI